MKMLNSLIITIIISFLVSACGKSPGTDNGQDPDGKIFITDRTGKKWNVTHAVKKYDFDTDNFQYGLGPFAITPINNPEMITPGESGYPNDNSSEAVIGLEIDGEARAYSIRVLTSHEVVNDQVNGKNFAVVY